MNNLRFLKVNCTKAFRISIDLNETGNDLIKECFHQSFLFQSLKSGHPNLNNARTPLKWKKLKLHIRHVMLREFKNNKTTTETAKKNSCVFDQGVITDL